MGLDMHLSGKKYCMSSKREIVDGFERKEEILALGYWRKHPNLHGYIVKEFGNNVDDCTEIDLSAVDIEQIISTIQGGELPETTGFFFGQSDGSERDDDIKIFTDALKWLKNETEGVWRSISYQASW